MSIIQFFRILWSRSLVVAVAMAAAFIGALVVVLIAQPRYEATSRVMMGLLKPDAVTGRTAANPKTIGPYIATQKEIIKDYEVSGRAAEALGWLSDPQKVRQYQGRPASDTRDFRRWLAQRVADRTTVNLQAGQILEITFSSGIPAEAKVGAESLREAYLDYSLATRRGEAAKNAAWWSKQAEQAKAAAEKAELVKATTEKEFGIVMEGKQDMDSQRLQALSRAAAVPISPNAQVSATTSVMELAQIDAQIAQASTSLGANHPMMQELQNRRQAIAAVAAQERAVAQGLASGTTSKALIDSALQEQKSRVISQRDKVERLRQLESEVELRRQQYQKTAARAGDLSIEAAATETGMTPLSVVVQPTKPTFPNKPLILGGSLALGFAFGLALAFLIELLNRRVRGIDDLEGSFDVPCLGIVDSARQRASEGRLTRLASIIRPKKAVPA